MIRNIKPVQVSPTIKAARWIFLFLGIIYGATKLKAYRIIEKQAYIKRQQHFKEQHERHMVEGRKFVIQEITELAKDFEVQELPRGWEDDL